MGHTVFVKLFFFFGGGMVGCYRICAEATFSCNDAQ